MNAPRLGIRRGTVRLVEHQPEWMSAFADLSSEIAGATGIPSGRIQHVGSTSVPGLAAKPIIDVVVGIEPHESADDVAGRLVGSGFVDRGPKGGHIGRLVVRETEPDIRTVHIHIVEHASEHWRRHVGFRDRLVHDPRLRARYESLKRFLAERFPDDRSAYRSAKEAFIAAEVDA